MEVWVYPSKFVYSQILKFLKLFSHGRCCWHAICNRNFSKHHRLYLYHGGLRHDISSIYSQTLHTTEGV